MNKSTCRFAVLRRTGGLWAALYVAMLISACGGGSSGGREGDVAREQAQAAPNIVLTSDGPWLDTHGRFKAVDAYLSQSPKALRSDGGKARATFRISVPREGFYEVYAWWPQAVPGVANAHVTVNDGRQATVLGIDQRAFGGQWNSLGTFQFDPATRASLDFESAGSPLVVDAVRLRYAGSERPPLVLQTDALPLGMRDTAYEAQLSAGGGVSPYRFALSGGALPDGIHLDAATGRLSGRLPEVGRFEFSIVVTDATGARAERRLALEVGSAIGSEEAAKGQMPGAAPIGREKPLTSDGADLGNLLNIIAATPEGGWSRVNLNSFSDVWAPADLRPLFGWGNPTPSKIIAAWSSFAWDSNRGNLLIYGGGHANYRGNDTYLWRGSTQRWERASLPSEMIQDSLGNWNAVDGADHAPASAHTYDNTLFFPVIDRLVVFGGAADANGGHYLRKDTATTSRKTGPYLFDPSRAHPDKVGGTTGSHVKRVAPYPEILGGGMWSNRESWLNASATSAPPSEAFVNGCAASATEGGRDVGYVRTASALYRYVINDLSNPAMDSWQRVGVYWSGPGGKTVCAYDSQRRTLVRTGTNATPFVYWNLNTPGPDNRDVTFAPSDPIGEFQALLSSNAILLPDCGLDFDRRRGMYALWCGDGRVWNLTPPPSLGPAGWTIRRAPSPATPVPNGDVGTGILGKWKYIDSLGVFMALQDAVAGNIWIYKPVGWSNPTGGNLPPTVSLSSPTEGSSFTVGATIPLRASAADTDGSVAKVEFFVGASRMGEDSTSPYSLDWSQAQVGQHTLSAMATDNDGATATSAVVHVTVMAANAPPAVSLTQPVDGASFIQGSSITLTASASDADGSVTKVEFLAGDSKIGEDATAPYSMVWSGAPAGNHVLKAIAVDDAGARTTSAGVSVTVESEGGGTTIVFQRGAGAGQVADTYLSTYHRTLSFGASAMMLEYLQNYSPLVRFAIFQSEGGPVPDGAHIRSAVLSVYKYSYYDVTYGVHRMLQPWSEAAATWNQRDLSQVWAVPGANGIGSDFLSLPDATASAAWEPGWVAFDVTQALQQMSSSVPTRNYGWRLRAISGYTTALKRFYTSEHQADTSLRPKLIVTYE